MEVLASINVILVFTVVFLLLFWWMQRRPRNLPPGPISYPVVGSFPSFLWYKIKSSLDYHEILTDLGKFYGKIYTLNVFGNYMFVISDQKLLKEALSNSNINDRHSNQIVDNLFGTNLHTLKDFQPFRRFAMTTFRHFGVGKRSFEEKVITESEILLDVVANLGGKACELHEFLNNATANVICSVVFGKRYEYDDDEFKHFMHIANRINDILGAGGSENSFPLFALLPSKAKREVTAIRRPLQDFLNNIIDAHRVNFDEECINDFVDAYLNELKLDGQQQVTNQRSFRTDTNMRGQLTLLFVAGADTTSVVLYWGILFMITHPDVQSRVQSELDSVVGRKRFPRVTDKPSLPYTRAVIQEIFRMASPVPLAVFHSVSKDTTIGPYSIPKGSTVVPNIWAIHRDSTVWSEPDKFRPERFIDDQTTQQENPVIPFSVGRRSCPGEALAQTMVFIFFTHLLHQFKFEIPEGYPSPSLRGELGIVFKPKSFEACAVVRDRQ